MNELTPVSLYGAHRVRVMWERPYGIWAHWPLRGWRKPVPVYVFIAYIHGRELPVRIGFFGDGEQPFVIEDPLAYDGGYFNHGPYASANRYDAENHGHTLSDLFEIMHRWARYGADGWNAGELRSLQNALDQFYSWVWREHRRDRGSKPGLLISD
jgi:hypothetical protein